jgi:hypothetical protein
MLCKPTNSKAINKLKLLRVQVEQTRRLFCSLNKMYYYMSAVLMLNNQR